MILDNKSILKIICLGDSNVGKSTIISRLQNKKFTPHYKATIGIDFVQKDITFEDFHYQLQIWDTAGQENYRSIGGSYYKNSDCCILVFDKTVHKSFEEIEVWRRNFIERSNLKEEEQFPFVLIGNKNDLKDRVEVSEEEIVNKCNMNKYIYYDVSAKEDEDKFDMLVIEIIKQIISREKSVRSQLIKEDFKLRLEKKKSKKNESCCN